mgnify:CR=1 FL=1
MPACQEENPARRTFLCRKTKIEVGLPQGSEPSQALPRQLPRRGSQDLKPVAKVSGAMRKFPTVLLPLPLRKDFPRSGGRCRAATKGGVWHRAAMTERAHAVSSVAPSQALPRQLPQRGSQAVRFITKVLGAMRKFPAVPKSSPFGGAGTPSGVTERVLSHKPKRLPRRTEQPFWLMMKRRK